MTIEQCQPLDQQRTKTTIPEGNTNFADKSEPTLYQGTAVAAEEAGTDGTTNVRGRSIDWNIMKTTVMKLPTDCVTRTEPTLARVSPVVAKMAHTDGARVMQYQSDDQKIMKTTNMQTDMDFRPVGTPVGPRRMFSPYELNQPVAVGPADQPCTTGPVGTHERERDYTYGSNS